jgi:hypothetical protein
LHDLKRLPDLTPSKGRLLHRREQIREAVDMIRIGALQGLQAVLAAIVKLADNTNLLSSFNEALLLISFLAEFL